MDDAPERKKLLGALERFRDVAVVGACANGLEAIETIGRIRPDLVFLDAQSPGASGFDVVRALGPEFMPQVIFVSEVSDHAVRAFEVHALDYLLRPVDEKRLESSIH